MVGREIDQDVALGYKSRENAELAYWTAELERVEQARVHIEAMIAKYALLGAYIEPDDGLGDW